MELILSVVLLILHLPCVWPKTYNNGRLEGQRPSVAYLMKNKHLLDLSYVPRRARWGSSKYTPNNVREGVKNGSIYWAGDAQAQDWFVPGDAKMPTICTNVYKKRGDGSVPLGTFICPMDLETFELHYCCGEVMNETCCNLLTAEIFYFKYPAHWDSLFGYYVTNAGVIVIVITIIFLPFVAVCSALELCRNKENNS